jgi:hypothetical protein
MSETRKAIHKGWLHHRRLKPVHPFCAMLFGHPVISSGAANIHPALHEKFFALKMLYSTPASLGLK